MELAEASLDYLIEKNKINNIHDSIKICFEILEGLCHLQKFKISHRDIKPLNILRGQDGKYKLGDMGICR